MKRGYLVSEYFGGNILFRKSVDCSHYSLLELYHKITSGLWKYAIIYDIWNCKQKYISEQQNDEQHSIIFLICKLSYSLFSRKICSVDFFYRKFVFCMFVKDVCLLVFKSCTQNHHLTLTLHCWPLEVGVK